jgi:signal transduction histidine kinase
MDSLSQAVYIIIFSSLFVLLLIVAVIIMVLVYQKRQIKFLKEKENLKMQFENQLLESQVEIHEQTLKNISEEIHDNIGQMLSLVKLNLNTFPPDLEEPVQKKISDTEELLGKAINDLRDLNQSMHGDKISAMGLEAALAQELKQLQKTGMFDTELLVEGHNYQLEQQKEIILFRIVQEALNNAIKHSGAKKIAIYLLYSPESFLLKITDNGKGFDATGYPPSLSGIGLGSMKNRAVLMGADFVVHSSAGNGTGITIELKKTTP